jgi:hypothetical protein
MAGTPIQIPPHAVSAVLRCAGRQHAKMTVHYGGTPEAYIAVTVGRSLIYMHTRLTTERFGQIWTDAQVPALGLPAVRPLTVVPGGGPDRAEPSVVVHTSGQPPAGVRMTKSVPITLSVTIGDLAFLIYDQRAFTSMAEPFLRAMDAGRELLPDTDMRHEKARRSTPTLAGAAANTAAAALLAAATFRPTRRVPGATASGAVARPQAARIRLRKPPGAAGGHTR